MDVHRQDADLQEQENPRTTELSNQLRMNLIAHTEKE